MPKLRISPVGAANVVKTIGKLNQNAKLPYRFLAVLDGDQAESVDYWRLPTYENWEAPEKVVFMQLKQLKWADLDQRLEVGAGTLFNYLNNSVLIADHHKWTAELGNKVAMDKDEFWRIMCKCWCKYCLTAAYQDYIQMVILNALPK